MSLIYKEEYKSISGLVVKCKLPIYICLKQKVNNLIAIVAIDGPRVRFAADAIFFPKLFPSICFVILSNGNVYL